MFIKLQSRKSGKALIEMMIAMGIFGLVGGAVGSAYVFGLRSFQALSNYAVLDAQNRKAMDTITKEIREATSTKVTPLLNPEQLQKWQKMRPRPPAPGSPANPAVRPPTAPGAAPEPAK